MHAIKIEKLLTNLITYVSRIYLFGRTIEFLGNCNDRHTFLDLAKFGPKFSFGSSNFLIKTRSVKPVNLFEKNLLLGFLDFLKTMKTEN